MKHTNDQNKTVENPERREFIKNMSGLTAVLASSGLLSGCDVPSFDAFFQKHFKELGPEELKKVLARLEKEYSEKYKREIKVSATPPIENTMFGYGLDLAVCVGCRRCVYACAKENNLSRNPTLHWIRVSEMEKDKGFDMAAGNLYYNPEKVPEPGKFYLPIQCQQCASAPCVAACPIGATWQEPDGIVVMDYNWCIGCRYCMAACPYEARHFNWVDPVITTEEINPDTEYLGNRPQPMGVVGKCTFCIQRTRKGLYPACLEACPAGARKFGNLLDDSSEIRQIMKNRRVFVLKEELNTKPKFFYFYGN